MIDNDLPILVLIGAEPDGAGLTTAVGAMLGAATARAAQASVLSALVAEDLLRHMHLKLHFCGVAQRRSQHFFGRLGNLLMGNDPDYIEMTGRHVSQTLELLGVESDAMLNVYHSYMLRADVARQAHDILGAQLGVAPEVLQRGL